MRIVFGLVLVVGLGLAGFAVFMVQNHFAQKEAELAAQRAAAAEAVPTVPVIAVNRAVGFGEELTAEDVVFVRYAEPYLPEGVYLTVEALFPQGPDVARRVLRPMEANEPVLQVKVTEPGEAAGITSRLNRGMRAFAISVDVSSGVSGFLMPGDRVDVYWTGRMNVGLGAGQEVTKLIDTALELVAVDQTADANRSEARVARTVTVQATPQQVANLAQAQATGSLSLALVGHGDEIAAVAADVDQRTLLGIEEVEEVAAAPVAAPEVCTIRTRRGAEVVAIPIPCSD